MSDWPYTLEKIGGMWHWSLKTSQYSMNAYSGCAFTKRGAKRVMKRIKSREKKRRDTFERGTI